MSAAKAAENARLASAFGLSAEREEGAAFARMGKEACATFTLLLA